MSARFRPIFSTATRISCIICRKSFLLKAFAGHQH